MEIDPEAFRTARERVSLTQEQLKTKLNNYVKMNRQMRDFGASEVKLEDVISWESGVRGLTSVEALAVTDVCMVPFYFLFDGRLPPEPLADFRGRPGTERRKLEYDTRRHLHRFDRYYELVSDLSQRLGETEHTNLPTAGNISEKTFARRLRGSLGVTREIQESWSDESVALREWVQRASDRLGVFVFSLPMDVQQVRGASRWDDGSPPAVLISTGDNDSAKIFTLIHELAHLSHRHSRGAMCDPSSTSNREVESRMNRIAAEVLVPQEWIREEIALRPKSEIYKKWPTTEKRRLTGLFHVSNQMMGIRLKELGIVRDDGYKSGFWKALNRGFGGGSANRKGLTASMRLRRYLGIKGTSLVARALKQDAVSVGELVKNYLEFRSHQVEDLIAD